MECESVAGSRRGSGQERDDISDVVWVGGG